MQLICARPPRMKQPVQTALGGELRMERRGDDVVLPDDDRLVAMRREDLDAGADRSRSREPG